MLLYPPPAEPVPALVYHHDSVPVFPADFELRDAIREIRDAAERAMILPGVNKAKRNHLYSLVGWCDRFKLPDESFVIPDGKPARRAVVKSERDRQVAIDDRCRYCGKRKATTADHVVPESRGGATSPDNIRACCKLCNEAKADRTPEEWADDILRAVGRSVPEAVKGGAL